MLVARSLASGESGLHGRIALHACRLCARLLPIRAETPEPGLAAVRDGKRRARIAQERRSGGDEGDDMGEIAGFPISGNRAWPGFQSLEFYATALGRQRLQVIR